MSNGHHNVSSLVTDLVEMAQATKRLPELERELAEARRIMERDGATIQRLELKLQDRAIEIDDLKAKLRSAEVERDDAGFRQLEAEDRVTTMLRHIETTLSGMGQTIAAVRGDAKDQTVRMTAAEQDEFADWKDRVAAEKARAAEEAAKPVDPTHVEQPSVYTQSSVTASDTATSAGERAVDPTGESWAATPSPLAEPSGAPSTTGYIGANEGVSVPSDPTVSQPTSQSETVQDTSVQSPDGVLTQGKYSGRRYADWPYYVSEESWCANGGTHDSYWDGRGSYRPVQQGV